MYALGDASRYIGRLYEIDPDKADRALFLLSVATGGPAKAVAIKAAEEGMEKAGITDAIASINETITENIAASIPYGNISVEELRERINRDKDGDDALLKEGTGFFLGAVVGVAGGSSLGKAGDKSTDVSLKTDALPDTDLKSIHINAGSKNNWDKAVNGQLDPQTTYKLDNGHNYTTDANGRVAKVDGELSLNTMDRNKYQQCSTGTCGNVGDEGGQLIASSLGGW